MEDGLLPHDSINAGAKATIIFIHGALVSRKDWDLVVFHISDYHLLVPDLPSHGAAQHLKPFSLEYAAELLCNLIESRAIGGVAHVVGLSLGARVALCLAHNHPQVVSSMVISGYGRLPQSWFTPYLPYAIWTEQRVERALPRSLVRWLMDGADLSNADLKFCNVELIRQIFVEALSPDGWPPTWPARTLIIAATKRGIIPSDDNAEAAKKVAEIGREQNSDTYAVAHSGMRHPWNRQAPELFAAVVKAWIEQAALPKGFRSL